MPPKAKPTATAAKAIQKRSSRPAAAAAVKAATANLLPQRRSAQRRGAASPPVQPQSRSASPTTSIGGGDERIGALELQNRALLESLDEVKERHDELMDLFTSLRSDIRDRGPADPVAKPVTIPKGMTPGQAVQHYMPWVDTTTLANVVSCTLDIAHFIKLIAPEERPKGQINFGLATGMHIDTATGKTSLVSESTNNYEKAFPDCPTLTSALSAYLAIRALHDIDHLGWGYAIGLYIQQLAIWSKHHHWPLVVGYFVAHFRRYQNNPDPAVWTEIDIQLFAMHITADTIRLGGSNNNRRETSKSQTSEICHNWNVEKGCHWKTCTRKHVCMQCSGEHPSFRCTKPKSS
jgi:hypothetical protein